jgi:hypothetical protein
VVLIGLAIVLRLVLFGLSFAELSLTGPNIDLAVPQRPSAEALRLTYERLASADPQWYLDIARNGYAKEPFTTSSAKNWGFFPGWPAAIRLAEPILPGDLTAGSVILANVLSLAAFALLYKLFRLDLSPTISFAAVALLIVSPGAFHLGRPESEPLFLLVTVGSFYLARRNRWAAAGLLGGLASLTRPTGVLMLPALVVLYVVQLRRSGANLRRPKSWLRMSWLALVPLGFFSFMWYLKVLTGNFMAYFDQKRLVWDADNRFPFLQLLDWFRHPTVMADLGWDLSILSAVLFTGLTATVVIGLVRRRDLRLPVDYWVFIVVSLVALAARNTIAGPSRYTLVVFPQFALIVLLLRRRPAVLAVMASSFLMIQAFLFVLSQDLRPWAN